MRCYYYPYFTDEERHSEGLSDLPKAGPLPLCFQNSPMKQAGQDQDHHFMDEIAEA